MVEMVVWFQFSDLQLYNSILHEVKNHIWVWIRIFYEFYMWKQISEELVIFLLTVYFQYIVVCLWSS